MTSDSRPWSGLDWQHRTMIIDCGPAHHRGRGVDPLCHDCARNLGWILDDVPALLNDLRTAVVRDVQFVQHGTFAGARSADDDESGLPWDERARNARNWLIYELRQAGNLAKLSGRASAIARQLRAELGRLARNPAMPYHAYAISRAVDYAHHAIDRPQSLCYYGPCPWCERDIFIDRVDEDDRDAWIMCPRNDCSYAARPEDHRHKALDAGDDRWFTIAELVGAITSAGETVTRDQIKGWIRREHLPRRRRSIPRWDPAEHKIITREVDTYRLGDVRHLALEAEARRQEKS